MAEKAVVMSVTDLQKFDDTWHITVAARATSGTEGGSVEVLATVTSTTFNALSHLRNQVIDAVIAAADLNHSLDVDEVLFGEF